MPAWLYGQALVNAPVSSFFSYVFKHLAQKNDSGVAGMGKNEYWHFVHTSRPLNFSIIVSPMALGWKTSYEVVGMDGIKIQSTYGFKLFYK